MLERIATALNQKLTVVMTAREPEQQEVREAFHRVVQMLRRFSRAHDRQARGENRDRSNRTRSPSSETQRIAHRDSRCIVSVSSLRCQIDNWQSLPAQSAMCQTICDNRLPDLRRHLSRFQS
jgi:hypothetical protein